jgi:hypothetical protein
MPKACPETHRRAARRHRKKHTGDGEAHVQCEGASCALDGRSDIEFVRPRLDTSLLLIKALGGGMGHIPDATVVQPASSCS